MADRMAERQAAPATGSPPVRPSTIRATHDTARIALHDGKPQLPGWFWATLGCFSVLAVGFTALFFVAKPGAGPAAATSSGDVAAAAGSVAAGASDRGAPGIQVEQLAPPQRPAVLPKPAAPAVRARPVHAVKLARTASPRATNAPASDAPAAAAAADNDDNAERTTAGGYEDDPGDAPAAPAKAPAAKAAPAKGAGARAHAAAADDSKDDSSSDSP
jgi:hypothetical protein